MSFFSMFAFRFFPMFDHDFKPSGFASKGTNLPLTFRYDGTIIAKMFKGQLLVLGLLFLLRV